MARNRHLSSSALLVLLIFLMAAVGGLYLFQSMVRGARDSHKHLVADLVVRLNDRTPFHLVVRLTPEEDADPSTGRFDLAGQGTLRAGAFPWKEAPLEARLELCFDTGSFNEGTPPFTLATTSGQLVARYHERLLGRSEHEARPVPCLGQVKVSKLEVGGGSEVSSWDGVERLEGLLELQCHGSGPDLAPSTDDDLHFTLLGTLDYRYLEPN